MENGRHMKIELSGLAKTYNQKDYVLQDFQYTFESGRFYAIMGPSGAGKSTLLHILGLLDEPSAGEIRIDGKPLTIQGEEERADMRLMIFGFVFQEFFLNPKLTVLENVMVPMHIHPEYQGRKNREKKKERARELLRQFQIDTYEERYPSELSGGEQQRVGIARALANDPAVILADEPTGNLDEKNEENIFNYLKMLAESGKMVIVVSHNEAVKEYADSVLVLEK